MVDKVCIICGKAYRTSRTTSKFCCMECKQKHGSAEVQCAACGKSKIVYRSAIIKNTNHFCDNNCQWKWRKENNECMGDTHPNKKEWIKVICVNCENEFTVRPDRFKRNESKTFYCRTECQNEYKAKSIGDKHPRYSQVDIKCDNCGNIFKKKKSHSEYSDRHFCCKSCFNEGVKATPIPCADYDGSTTGPIIANCEICSIPIIMGRSKYDNSQNKKFYCSEHRFQAGKGERNYNWKGSVIVDCDRCGITFETKQSRVNASGDNRIYCSRKCAYKHHSELFRGANHPNWTGGPNSLSGKIRGNPEYISIKKECFERDNYHSFLSGKASKKKNGLNHHHLNSLSYLIETHGVTIENYQEFNDIFLDINNVITLLDYEHESFHKLYGYKTTKSQFEEFKNKYLGDK